MDLNGPGTSIFQGDELSNFNTLVQREEEEEEEEALEEQRRRDLELKNELENAFDDVSFDNDEDSICTGSENRSSSEHSTAQNNIHTEVDAHFFKGNAQNIYLKDFNNSSRRKSDSFNSPLKQTMKSSDVNKNEFNNEFENFSDECRKIIQNGTLHDIVDQSGGGDLNNPTLHYNHCFQRNSIGEAICNGLPNNSKSNMSKTKYIEGAEDSSEQLKILYDIRVREVHKLTELIDSVRNEHALEVKDLKHQLSLMLAEKERVNISNSQLQNLLVDCKQEVDQLVKSVNHLEEEKKELQLSKTELENQFDTAKLIIDDLQRKILALEKGSRNKCETEQYELNLKNLTEKHNMELLNVKKELDCYMKNYETLVKENEDLKLKIINLGQINDENLAKKGEIISRLSQQIEDTQRQCENLLKLSTTEDNFRLQGEIKVLKEEKTNLTLKLENLEKERSRQEEELKQYESLSQVYFSSNDSSSALESKDVEALEVNGKLGAELLRALNGQKAKRLEIKNLQAQMEKKNEQISELIERESRLNKELTDLKEEIKKYQHQLNDSKTLISKREEECSKIQNLYDELKTKIKTSDNDFQSKYEQLLEDNKCLKEKLSSLEKEKAEVINNYSEEYLRFHNEGLEKVREQTEKYFKLEMLKKDLENENLKKEIEEIKNLYVDVCNAKEQTIAQLEKERNNSSSAMDLEEVKKLQKELEKSRSRILELDQTLKHQYEQEVEILNLDINQLRLQLEKLKKEKDREISEKDRVLVENELLKTEVEQITSEKNLLFLEHEKLLKEAEELRSELEKINETSKNEYKKILEKHSSEMQNLSNKYEITIKKLKKEIELQVKAAVHCESKQTSPMKNIWMRNAATQGCRSVVVDKSTSPGNNPFVVENKTSRDMSVLTDPEPIKIPKKEVIEMMEKLGAHHEEEMKALGKKYRAELIKLEKKFHVEVDKAKEVIRRELKKEHNFEIEQLKEKHRIEMENRIEQEKKEAVVDLITEWACEVQSLKVSYAESQAEMEKMKMKYKAAKSVALQYKTYFKNKAEHMKEEWKRIEEGYEKALKDLEKNVHILVDVKEDEVKAKVDSITKLYEQKICKMKEKLSKCEGKLKAEKSKSPDKTDFRRELERLTVPEGNLCQNLGSVRKKKPNEVFSLLEDGYLLKETESKSKSQKKKHSHRAGEVQNDKETTNR